MDCTARQSFTNSTDNSICVMTQVGRFVLNLQVSPSDRLRSPQYRQLAMPFFGVIFLWSNFLFIATFCIGVFLAFRQPQRCPHTPHRSLHRCHHASVAKLNASASSTPVRCALHCSMPPARCGFIARVTGYTPEDVEAEQTRKQTRGKERAEKIRMAQQRRANK
jgi:hypothetical protein